MYRAAIIYIFLLEHIPHDFSACNHPKGKSPKCIITLNKWIIFHDMTKKQK